MEVNRWGVLCQRHVIMFGFVISSCRLSSTFQLRCCQPDILT
jgi:hypothetical protein